MNDSRSRLLNVVYNQSDRGNRITFFRSAMLAADADLYNDLVPLVEHGMLTARRQVDLADLSAIGWPDHAVRRCVLKPTLAGTAWVEDDPRNSLLRAINASPLGRVTLRRAANHADTPAAGRKLIHAVVHDGYASMHQAESKREVARMGLIMSRMKVIDLDAYVLLPTPKIRKVLGS